MARSTESELNEAGGGSMYGPDYVAVDSSFGTLRGSLLSLASLQSFVDVSNMSDDDEIQTIEKRMIAHKSGSVTSSPSTPSTSTGKSFSLPRCSSFSLPTHFFPSLLGLSHTSICYKHSDK